jgi:hypothetical protein
MVEQYMYSIDVALNDATCGGVQPALLSGFHIFYVMRYFAGPLKHMTPHSTKMLT